MSSPSPDRIVHAIAGGIGGAAALIVTYPLVTVSCHQQTNKKQIDQIVKEIKQESKQETENETELVNNDKKTITAWELIKDIFKNDGILGFYSGMESAIYGMTLTNFIYYYFYESTGRIIIKNRNSSISKFSISNLKSITLIGLKPMESVLTGLIAGSITAILSNPFWVINTRSTINKTNKTFYQTFLEIYKKEGITSFLNGILPALILVINPIIQYSIFEQLKNFITKKNYKFKPIHAFFIGALAKLIATGTTYPYITLKSRMHLNNNKTMMELLSNILKVEGIKSLYNGIFVKLSQSIFTAAFLFFFKEQLVEVTSKLLIILKKINLRKSISK